MHTCTGCARLARLVYLSRASGRSDHRDRALPHLLPLLLLRALPSLLEGEQRRRQLAHRVRLAADTADRKARARLVRLEEHALADGDGGDREQQHERREGDEADGGAGDEERDPGEDDEDVDRLLGDGLARVVAQ
eukprot:5147654-Prymnesium_polylepis.1